MTRKTAVIDAKGQSAEWWAEQAARYKAETVDLQRRFDQLAHDHKQAAAEHRQEIDALREQHAQAQTGLREQMDEADEQARKRLDEQRQAHQKQLAEQAAQLKQQHEQALAALAAKLSEGPVKAELERLRIEHEERLQSLQAEHGERLRQAAGQAEGK